MNWRAEQPLSILLDFGGQKEAEQAGRLAMEAGLAQLEWSEPIIGRALHISPLHYPPEPGLQPARSRAFEGLHAFLADSLPEGWGALLMRRRLARLGMDFGQLSALDRLALVGRQGRGALVFEPATTPEGRIDPIDLEALAEESRMILLGEEGELADALADLGGASGGARPKVHVGFSADGGLCFADGDMPTGYEAWIVKFKAATDPTDIGPIEEAYANMAREAGVHMSETRLIPSAAGPGYFATRRFDRPGGGRKLHLVSLAGAIEAPPEIPGAIDYDIFLRATRAITRHEGDVEQAFVRMLFNVIAGNRDDHTRQHAYLMDEEGDWRLAPAFDLTFSNGPGGEHYLAVAGERRNPTRAGCERIGEAHGIGQRRVLGLIDQVVQSVANWTRHAAASGVGPSAAPIGKRLAEIRKAFG